LRGDGFWGWSWGKLLILVDENGVGVAVWSCIEFSYREITKIELDDA